MDVFVATGSSLGARGNWMAPFVGLGAMATPFLAPLMTPLARDLVTLFGKFPLAIVKKVC